MQSFATLSNYLLIMSDLPSSPIWCFRSTDPFWRMRQNGLFGTMKTLNQSRLFAGTSENSFVIFIPEWFLQGWHLNDFWTIQEYCLPETWTTDWKKSQTSGTDRRGRRVLHGTSPSSGQRSIDEATLGLGRFGRQFSCFDASLTRATYSQCREELYSTLLICLSREPSPIGLFMFQGTSVLESVE